MSIKNAMGWGFLVASWLPIYNANYELAMCWVILAELMFIHADIEAKR